MFKYKWAFSRTKEDWRLNLPTVQFAWEEPFDIRCVATRNRTIVTGRTEKSRYLKWYCKQQLISSFFFTQRGYMNPISLKLSLNLIELFLDCLLRHITYSCDKVVGMMLCAKLGLGKRGQNPPLCKIKKACAYESSLIVSILGSEQVLQCLCYSRLLVPYGPNMCRIKPAVSAERNLIVKQKTYIACIILCSNQSLTNSIWHLHGFFLLLFFPP